MKDLSQNVSVFDSTPSPTSALPEDSSLNILAPPPSDSTTHPQDSQPPAAPSSSSTSSPGLSTDEITLQHKTHPLANLPPELLNHITTYLPIPYSALLALTCKTIFQRIGTTYFAELSRGEPGPNFQFYFQQHPGWHHRERENFLLLLEKDLPSLVYCHFCAKIHDTLKTNDYNRKCTDDLARHDCRTLGALDSGYSRRYLLMRRHREGHDISKELGELFRSDSLQLPGSTVTRQHTTKVINGNFRTRTQHSITLPKGGEREALLFAIKWQSWDLCTHITWSEYDSSLIEQLYCRLKHPNKPCAKCAGLKKCHRCWVEFEVDTVALDGGKFALVVTSWRDLGAVDTPLDVKFRFLQRYSHRLGVAPTFEGLKRDFEGEDTSPHEAQLVQLT